MVSLYTAFHLIALMSCMQPLDVSVFDPLKSARRKIIQEFRLRTLVSAVEKVAFPSLLKELWERAVTPEHLVSRYRTSGLHPLNCRAISNDKLATSESFNTTDATSASVTVTTSTPKTRQVKSFFDELFKSRQEESATAGCRGKDRIRPNMYGEAFTSDDVIERLQLQAET